MTASPANVIHRALGYQGAHMNTEELIRTFMLAGYGMAKARKRIQEYAEIGIIYKNDINEWEMDL